jgi:hypothetical protein
MSKSLRLHIVLMVSIVLVSNYAFAQLDSLYTQQWNRDPVNNLSATASAQRQIITAEQIRVSGYTQLSQVFQLIDGWTIKYPSGNYQAPQLQSNGTGNYNHQNWVLMLNGQRIEMNRDGAIDVDQLAIPIYDIERIEIVNTNGMYLGEFTQNGLINIITKKNNKDEINIGGMVGTASSLNNTLENWTTNNFILSAGYNKNKFHLNTTIALQDGTYDNSIFASGIELQYLGKKISHQIQTKSLSGYRNTDYHLVGYLGQWNMNERNQIRLSSTMNANDIPSAFVFQYGNNIQHRYLKNHTKGNFIWQNGISYDYIQYLSNTSGNPDYYENIIKPYSSINIPITRKTNLFSDIQVAFSNNKVAPKVSLGIFKRVSFISNYSFVVGYNEMLLEESFLTTINQDIYNAGTTSYFYNPKLATADFYYNINIGNNVKFSYNSGLKNSYDLPDINYRVFTDPIYLSGYYYTKRSTYQFNWVNRINIHYDIIKNLVFDINYMNTSILNTWDDNLRPIPKHKFTFLLQYDLPKKFTIWSRNYLQSQTQFLSYDAGYSLSTTKPYYSRPLTFTWEIGLSKKLLKDHINLNLTARNLLTTNNDYYSTSMPFYTGLFISITANIDGLGESKSTLEKQ